MTHLDKNQLDLFPALRIGDRCIDLHHAKGLAKEIIPQVSRLITDLENAGLFPPETARRLRLDLLALRLAVHGAVTLD